MNRGLRLKKTEANEASMEHNTSQHVDNNAGTKLAAVAARKGLGALELASVPIC